MYYACFRSEAVNLRLGWAASDALASLAINPVFGH